MVSCRTEQCSECARKGRSDVPTFVRSFRWHVAEQNDNALVFEMGDRTSPLLCVLRDGELPNGAV